ncbi:MAG: hypothetical protein AAGJ86_00050 [Pseudomonadota bacterium]
MPQPLRVTVPGKIMLAGEYAVLRGGVAMLASTTQVCEATLRRHSEPDHSIRTVGFREGTYRFSIDARARVTDVGGDSAAALRLPVAVIEEFPPRKPVSLSLDTRAFYTADRKLGLGSSAAATVALAEVLARFNGDPDVRRSALNAHRAFQGGHGSGADIYAVQQGGVVSFQRSEGRNKLTTLPWPESLHATVFTLSTAAPTVSHIQRFDAWLEKDATAERLLGEMIAATHALGKVWRSGDAAAIIESMRELTQHMLAIDAAGELGYTAGGHAALLQTETPAGVLYKPVGAGGGDLGLALSDDPTALAAFASQVTGKNCTVLDTALGVTRPTRSWQADEGTS